MSRTDLEGAAAAHPPPPALRPSVLPGLAAVAGAAALAFAIARFVPALDASTVAVALGALATNLGLHRPVLRPGTQLAASGLLRVAVVVLGLQLAVPDLLEIGGGGLAVVAVTVAVTFTGTQLLGRAFGLSRSRSLLVATGFSICGASAIGAMREVAGGDEEDTAVSIALVTLCGSLAIVLLPAVAIPLGLDSDAFGLWVGASVQDVGQAVATASRVDGALTTAVAVKLSRVVLLAPLVAAVALTARSRFSETPATTTSTASGRRPPILPWFVIGFVAAIALRSTGVLPGGLLDVAADAQHLLMVAALVGLGTGIHLRTLRATGGRTLLLGLAAWALVAGTSYAGVLLVTA